MDIVLVPGFWLGASSWRDVTPALTAAGHTVHPLTLPGLESVDAPRAAIGLRTHVDAVAAVVDSLDGPVVLVGHSGAGAIVHAVVDARPGRVARAIYVDTGPQAAGAPVNTQLPSVGDDIPLPPWDFFDDEDLVGLSEQLKADFRAAAVPQPKAVAYDPQQLHDERRYETPVTVIACEFPSAMIPRWIEAGEPMLSELGLVREVDYIDLPTGHWPQFTRPDDLATAILGVVGRSAVGRSAGGRSAT